MLYVCVAMVLDVAIFMTGLTMSIIDVNRYNFGLYLVLMSVVAFSLLVALWVARPKFCRTPTWAVQLYHNVVKSSRPNRSAGEIENLIERPNADEIMRSVKGIPLLIQAIQYSLEAAYVAPECNTTGQTMTDSAIESIATTTHDCFPNLTMNSSEQSSDNENIDADKNGKRQSANLGADRRVPKPQTRRLADLKRQSIFVVFPYSETVPIDQSKLRMRRSSSEHDLLGLTSRKSSFQRFYSAIIAGQRHCDLATLNETETRKNSTERSRSMANKTTNDRERRTSSLKLENVKKAQTRRPSIEVRYVGLQRILLAKMSSRHGSSKEF